MNKKEIKELADKYSYRVFWSEEDGEFVGAVTEFSLLSWLEKDKAKALEGIYNIVCETLEDMFEGGDTPPEPLSMKKYSGKFLIRTTPESHKKLAIEALENNVSLNKYVCDKLNDVYENTSDTINYEVIKKMIFKSRTQTVGVLNASSERTDIGEGTVHTYLTEEGFEYEK